MTDQCITCGEPVADHGAAMMCPSTAVCVCGCGRAYNRHAWGKLRYVGVLPDGSGGVLELRDCICGSTISVDARVVRRLQLVTDRDRAVGRRAAAKYLSRGRMSRLRAWAVYALWRLAGKLRRL